MKGGPPQQAARPADPAAATQAEVVSSVVRPWDTPGLPPRTHQQRCARHHGLCAFRDDDPARCSHCHQTWVRIEADRAAGRSDWDRHGGGSGVASGLHVHPPGCGCAQHQGGAR